MSDIKPDRANIKSLAQKERKPPKKITADYLHNAGLYYLGRFAAGSGHFRRVMARKIDRSCQFHKDQDRDACMALLTDLIDKFQRAGLIDDGAYLRGSVSSLRRRGLSARAIEARLAAKSVPQRDIRAALQADNDEKGTDDLAAAVRLARKKRLGTFTREGVEPQPDKAMAALARAGFDYETARRALNMQLDEAEALLNYREICNH